MAGMFFLRLVVIGDVVSGVLFRLLSVFDSGINRPFLVEHCGRTFCFGFREKTSLLSLLFYMVRLHVYTDTSDE